MKNFKETMMGVIRGETPEGMIFVPRLDIWYNRNKAHNSLPEGYANLSLREVASKLGVGFHSVVPDFIRSAPVEDIYHRALGFYNNPDFPFRADFSAVDFETEQNENDLKVTYPTQSGIITTRCSYGRNLFENGYSIPDIIEHAVKKPEDFLCLAEIFSKVKIYPEPVHYQNYQNRVGNDGIAVAFLSLACGPMHHIMRDLRKFEDFCLDIYDPDSPVRECRESLSGIYDQLLESVLKSKAELVLFGANYDDTITYPPFFDEYIAPWLNKATDKMHGAGKFLSTHTDGENQGLLTSLKSCRFDVADSICPAPMTKVSFREYRDFFDKRTTIWGGVPSNIMLKSCCSDKDFKEFIQRIIQESYPYDHLILSIADTTPPDAEFDRILYLAEQCRSTWKK